MQFLERLREGVRQGRSPPRSGSGRSRDVRVGGSYRLPPGHVVVDSIMPIGIGDVTGDMARRSGFDGVVDLLKTAQHGSGRNVYFITFHYVGD